MKQLTIENIKEISLDGLKYFHSFCVANNLQYYLAYGSLLGAVRHSGFIPWDDDIDLIMPRKDYDLLIQKKKEIENENWELLSGNTDKKYKFQFAKLCNKKTVYYPSRFKSGLLYGVPIDIFPMDIVSDEKEAEQIKKKYFKRFISSDFIFSGQKKSGDFISLLKSIIKFILFGSYNKNIVFFHKKMLLQKEGDYFKSFFAPTCDLYKKEWFNSSKLMKFENSEFFVPVNYQQVLTSTYGDYMKLPPEEERIYKHEIEAYYKENETK